MRWLGAAAAVLTSFALTPPVAALEPRDVFVIYNKSFPGSQGVAEHYCLKRGVPKANLVPLDLPPAEEISRDDYNRLVVGPLKDALRARFAQAKVLLTVYGVPLRVGSQSQSDQDKAELVRLKPLIEQAKVLKANLIKVVGVLEDEVKQRADSPAAAALPAKRGELLEAERKVDRLLMQELIHSHAESQACLDSELMLLWWPPYRLGKWVDNPLYWQHTDNYRSAMPPTLLTCRLDGPNAEVAKRLVDDAVEVERKGLEGRVYVDARGIRFNPEADKYGTGYGGYDESFREMARLLQMVAALNVRLDDAELVFPKDSCPDCALYSGWYALGNYNKPCRFVKGAVAWHLASGEAISLRNPGKQWVGNLLLDGVAATLGPVAEPYTLGFPRPEEFFGFLVTGQYTLVECYARSQLFTSWMIVLVGDPLYNPYAKNPKLKPEHVWSSPQKAAKIVPGG